MGNGVKMFAGPARKRGRPSGHNRIPLSKEERRTRNAQYERERRCSQGDAMAELAVAVGCQPDVHSTIIFRNVLRLIRDSKLRDPADDIDSLRRCNEDLMAQIQSCESLLGMNRQKATEQALYHQVLFKFNAAKTMATTCDLPSATELYEPPAELHEAPTRSSEVPAEIEVDVTNDELIEYLSHRSLEEVIHEYLS